MKLCRYEIVNINRDFRVNENCAVLSKANKSFVL